MPHRGPVTAVLTAALGLAFGGVLVWRFYQTKRKRLPSSQKLADPADAPSLVESADLCPQTPPPLLEKEFKAVECQTQLPPAVQIPTCEQLLAVSPLTVSCEDEWQQLWPQMQKELSVLPVLGFDTEWVKADAVSNSLCLLLHPPSVDALVVARLLCPAAGFPQRQSFRRLPAAGGHLFRSVCPGEAAGLPRLPAAVSPQFNPGARRPACF